MSVVIDGTTGISGNNGSASTPAIQGEDTNTGVFFPAADTVAVATGGAERVRVDSSGNLAVGATSAINRLHVQNEIATAYSSANTLAAAPLAYFYNTNGSVGGAGTIRIDGGTSGGNGAVSISALQTAIGSSALTFGTRSGGSDVTERARITSTGDFQFNSGYGSVSTVYGCRAWVNFNGTNGAIRASGNVSSVTYNGTGQSTVNFTTAMPDVNYSAVCSGHSAGFNRQANAMPSSAGYATGSIVILYGNTINGAAENLSHVNVAVFR